MRPEISMNRVGWFLPYSIAGVHEALQQLRAMVDGIDGRSLEDWDRRSLRYQLERAARWVTYVVRCIRESEPACAELDALEIEQRDFVALVKRVVLTLERSGS